MPTRAWEKLLTASKIKPMLTASTMVKPQEKYFKSPIDATTLLAPEIKNVNQNKAMRLQIVEIGFFSPSMRFYRIGIKQPQ
jgi:hypothetical protein